MASIISSSSTNRDVSFSSYLNSSEEAYLHSLLDSTQTPRISHDSTTKIKVDLGEIDVFGAEKYFSGGIHSKASSANLISSKKYQHQHQHLNKDHNPGTRLHQPQTPSSHSEASWNSQSALLRRVQRISSKGSNSSNNNNNNNHRNSNIIINSGRVQGKRSFLLPCYCCDKSSIEIEEQAEVIPSFVFPVSDNNNSRALIDLVQSEGENIEVRKSLEVFGSGELDKDGVGNKSFSLERRLRMLSWDAIPRPKEEEEEEFVIPCESYRDDTGSDASSDLFEIECLSCIANPVVRSRVPSSEGCPTPTTCYAPSEASIEWSVVTADFSEDQRSTQSRPPKRTPAVSKSSRPGLLLGCKSQKAVRVAGEALPMRKLKKNEKQSNSNKKGLAMSMMSMNMSMSRFQAEAKVPIGSQKRRQEGLPSSSSPRWSHSSHASELMYIQ